MQSEAMSADSLGLTSPGSKGKLILSTAFAVVVADMGVDEWLEDGN